MTNGTEVTLKIIALTELEVELIRCVFSMDAGEVFVFGKEEVQEKERCQKAMDGLIYKIK